jgi:DNA-binding GntR family transcriptional regulator
VESHRRILNALKSRKVNEVEQVCKSHWSLLAGPTDEE